MSLELVVARYNESLDWLSLVDSKYKITVYNKGDGNFGIKLPNVGREAHTYLTHIIDNYDNLAETTIFCQGNPFDHSKNFIQKINELLLTNINDITNLSDILHIETLINDWRKNKKYNHITNLISFQNKLYESVIYDKDYILYSQGAIFAVPKFNILQHPKSFYIKLLSFLGEIDPVDGYNLERFWLIIFGKNAHSDLCLIMNKFGSDKGSGHHNYTILYNYLFKNIRNEKLRVFELGLGTNYTDVESSMGTTGTPGASLYGWREYFPNADIFGADIDKRILFSDHRIKTAYCDQTNPQSIYDLWKLEEFSESYDIIVEDGLHTLPAQITFLLNSYHMLKSGGLYICEDIISSNVLEFLKILNKLQFTEHTEFMMIPLPNKRNSFDNCILLLKKGKFAEKMELHSGGQENTKIL